MRKLTPVLMVFTLALPGVTLAADDEITMQVIEGETPEAVTRQIELPEVASEEAGTRSAGGLETANQARERNRHRNRQMEQENDQSLRARRQEMHEQRQQMQEQRREMQQQQRQMQEQLRQQQESTRDAMQQNRTGQ